MMGKHEKDFMTAYKVSILYFIILIEPNVKDPKRTRVNEEESQ
jgi:hypothetical protein